MPPTRSRPSSCCGSESFPFTISVGIADLRRYEGFNIHRQGLDMDMVALRKVKVEPPPNRRRNPRRKILPSPFLAASSIWRPKTSRTMTSRSVPEVMPSHHRADQPDPLTERRRIEESIKNEVLRTLSDRADRFLQVVECPRPGRALRRPFSQSAEQFRDGHYSAASL